MLFPSRCYQALTFSAIDGVASLGPIEGQYFDVTVTSAHYFIGHDLSLLAAGPRGGRVLGQTLPDEARREKLSR